MKPLLRAACLAGTCLALWSQSAVAPESLTSWPFYKEIPAPSSRSGLADFLLDRQSLDKTRDDQADLRLFDSAGREVPYVLRIRREVETRSLFTSREFNRAVEGGSAAISADLGAQPQEHNEVEIETSGTNFRRLVEVQGSADGARWSTLIEQAILFRFTADGRSVEQRSVTYPVSRYRYVRIRVERDPQVDQSAPTVVSLAVSRSVRVKREIVQFPGSLETRDADRVMARPASVWHVDLGGRVPLQGLIISTTTESFSRPFQLEAIDDPSVPVMLASGELTRRPEAGSVQPEIQSAESFARHLKLTVIDDRNPPLEVDGVTALSAARQVVFEAASAGTGNLRLYYGNQKALAPHYDVSARIPAELADRPARLTLGTERNNTNYRPDPKPLSERSPWLVYGVLGGASILLALILLNLVRANKAA